MVMMPERQKKTGHENENYHVDDFDSDGYGEEDNGDIDTKQDGCRASPKASSGTLSATTLIGHLSTWARASIWTSPSD